MDAASNEEELTEAFSLVMARMLMMTSDASIRIVWVECERFEGILTVDFSKLSSMEFLLRPTEAKDAHYRIQFRHQSNASHSHVLEFIQSIDIEPLVESVLESD